MLLRKRLVGLGSVQVNAGIPRGAACLSGALFDAHKPAAAMLVNGPTTDTGSGALEKPPTVSGEFVVRASYPR